MPRGTQRTAVALVSLLGALVLFGTTMGETLDTLDVTDTEQGLQLHITLNSPHQYRSVLPQRESDFFLIRLSAVALTGKEKKRTEHSRLPTPAPYRDLIEGVTYETNEIDGPYLILSLHRKANIKVQEDGTLRGLLIDVHFTPESPAECEPTPSPDKQ